MTTEKIAQTVQRYVQARPAVQECLRDGLINYSALARRVAKEERISNLPAAIAACRRQHLKSITRRGREEEVTKILHDGRLLVRTHLVMALLEHPRRYDGIVEIEDIIRKKRGTLNLIDGEESLAIITGREFRSDIKRVFSKFIIEMVEELVQLSFIFPRKALRTPGVAARLYSLLSGSGINVYCELTSCGDHLIVIHERDLLKALALIKPVSPE